MKSAVVCFLLAVCAANVFARPANVKELAARYAAKHPNNGDVEECQELHVEGQSDEVNAWNALVNEDYKWPNNILYYTILEEGYTTEQIALIEAGIADLQHLTEVNGQSCIQLVPRNDEPDYVYVENYSGCSSYVGSIGGAQRLSLVDGCVSRHGTIMHEFLHALGFHHEQKRYDRDDYVIINWENIEEGYENNFFKLGPEIITLLNTTYDYGSVMHYSAYAFAIDDTIPTIITLDEDAEIGQRITLSELDIERVQIYYGCLDAADSVHFKHLANKK
jgi:hypothetical protein